MGKYSNSIRDLLSEAKRAYQTTSLKKPMFAIMNKQVSEQLKKELQEVFTTQMIYELVSVEGLLVIIDNQTPPEKICIMDNGEFCTFIEQRLNNPIPKKGWHDDYKLDL